MDSTAVKLPLISSCDKVYNYCLCRSLFYDRGLKLRPQVPLFPGPLNACYGGNYLHILTRQTARNTLLTFSLSLWPSAENTAVLLAL